MPGQVWAPGCPRPPDVVLDIRRHRDTERAAGKTGRDHGGRNRRWRRRYGHRRYEPALLMDEGVRASEVNRLSAKRTMRLGKAFLGKLDLPTEDVAITMHVVVSRARKSHHLPEPKRLEANEAFPIEGIKNTLVNQKSQSNPNSEKKIKILIQQRFNLTTKQKTC